MRVRAAGPPDARDDRDDLVVASVSASSRYTPFKPQFLGFFVVKFS